MNETTTVASVLRQLRPHRPRWEGLHSFDRVWDACATEAVEKGITQSKERIVISVRSGINQRAARHLVEAHPINFGRAQFSAIRGIIQNDGVDPWEFLADYRPAFPTLYLDFSDAMGRPSELALDSDFKYTLYGAVVAGSTTGDEGMVIIPFGTTHIRNGNEEVDPNGTLEGGDPNDHHRGGTLYAPSKAAAIGSLNIGTQMIDLQPDGSFGSSTDTGPLLSLMANPMGNEIADFGFICPVSYLRDTVEPHDGTWPLIRKAPADAKVLAGSHLAGNYLMRELVTLPGDLEFPMAFDSTLDRLTEGKDADTRQSIDFARQSYEFDSWRVVYSSLAVMDALYFLDSHNVTLGEATVSRQVRRRAEREGIQIAQTVRVAATRVRDRRPGKGGTANYSHRFERKGYTRHVTKGSHAKADLMKPCYRRDPKTNELTCPDGCRREWVPPTIVGDENLPFVPKARIVPGPSSDN